jgi:hypothetical protein
MECEVCGSRNVTRRTIEGHLLEECNLCGNLQGDDVAAGLVEELRRGRERGLDEEVIPLVSILESSGVFEVTHSSAGRSGGGESPHVLFRLTKNDTVWLERLLRSLEMVNRRTRFRWLVELTLQHHLLYILRPRFWKPPPEITPEEITLARADLPLIAAALRRDLSLSWWKE